jgi:hypothetical protein
VAYTAYKRQDKKAALIANLGLEATITWDTFKYEFNRHFFPRVV